MTMTSPNKKINEVGSAAPALATALLAIVVLIVVITIYNRVLHTAEEEAAYRYSTAKTKLSQMKNICENKTKRLESFKIWVQQNSKLVIPPEYQYNEPCVVEIQEEK